MIVLDYNHTLLSTRQLKHGMCVILCKQIISKISTTEESRKPSIQNFKRCSALCGFMARWSHYMDR